MTSDWRSLPHLNLMEERGSGLAPVFHSELRKLQLIVEVSADFGCSIEGGFQSAGGMVN
jgi:hypothetical protein